MEGPPTLEFRALGFGQLDVPLGAAIPQVLGELDTLFGGQVTEVEDGRGHSRNLRRSRAEGKRAISSLGWASDVTGGTASVSRCARELALKPNGWRSAAGEVQPMPPRTAAPPSRYDRRTRRAPPRAGQQERTLGGPVTPLGDAATLPTRPHVQDSPCALAV